MDVIMRTMDFDFYSFRCFLRGELRPWLSNNNDTLFRAIQRQMGKAFRETAGTFVRALPYAFDRVDYLLPDEIRKEWTQNWFCQISGHYTRMAQPLLEAKSYCPPAQGLIMNVAIGVKVDFYTRFAAAISAAWMSKIMFFMQSDAGNQLKKAFLMQQVRSVASLILDTALPASPEKDELVILQRAFLALSALYLEIHNKFPDDIDKSHLRLQSDVLYDFPLGPESIDAETNNIRSQYIDMYNSHKMEESEQITKVQLVNKEVEDKTAINEILKDVVIPMKKDIDGLKKHIVEAIHSQKKPKENTLPAEDADVLIDSKEACRILGISESTLDRRVKEGLLHKKPIGRAVRYLKAEVIKLAGE